MRDLDERLAEARVHVAPKWTPLRERIVRERVEVTLAVSHSRRSLPVLFVAASLVVAALFFAWNQGARAPLADLSRAPDAAPPLLLRLDDGSSVSARSPDARVTPVEVGANSATLRLESGAAHFDVTPRVGREFRVQARDVQISVLGTAFTVELAREAVTVTVERGHVAVTWPGARRELRAGEQLVRTTRLPSALPAPDALPAAPNTPSVLSSATRPATRPAASSWRKLAQDGDYAAAFTRMQTDGRSAVRDEPDDLLFAADVARLSGHAELAVPRLERVVRAHATDSRAPLAAFTLGRTLLDELGRPREAAEAFALARRLSPSGALAQDALAREVEGWSRAGEASVARERAHTYLARYPRGRREKTVRLLAGLD